MSIGPKNNDPTPVSSDRDPNTQGPVESIGIMGKNEAAPQGQ